MCGICGFVGCRNDQKAIIKAMKAEIEQRGPDKSGSWMNDEVSLGFRRLSIIDLADGQQPMKSANGQLTIVFNGEIYNYQELREDLISKGYSFRTRSDTEVLVNGLQQYGAKVLEKLRGMFGFAVWDEGRKALLLARDFFGIKPVYYAVVDGCFVFASEIKSILQFPEFKRRINEEALEQYLSFQYSVLEETLFQGIYRLLPGNMLIYQDGKFVKKRYFSPTLMPGKSGFDVSGDSLEILQKELEEVLQMSVKRHMISDVEVGVFLSGGVDSGYLASASGVDKAFTVGFDEGSHYNEVAQAKEVTEQAGLEHHVKIITKQEYWDVLPKIMYRMDEPLGDASAVALYFLAQEASKYVKVVLSGEGADELFGGYNIYREPEALKWVSWLPMGFRRMLGGLAEKLPDIKGRDYLIRGGMSVEERFIGNAYVFKEKERREVLLRPSATAPKELLKDSYRKYSGMKDMEKMQSIDLNYWLPGDILLKADKMSMAHSLEVRVPFLDKDVFDLAARLPKGAKINGRTTKYLFRKAVAGYVPERTYGQKKLGFPIPIRVWMRQDDWYGKIREMFTSGDAKKFFHTEKLVALLEEHRAEKKDNSRKIWNVLAFLLWYREFFETA